MNFKSFLTILGLKKGCNVILHTSFKKIRNAFPDITIPDLFNTLKTTVSDSGSIVFPTFTYCFKKQDNSQLPYDSTSTPSKLGILSESFRKEPDVLRTNAPTHSFAVWGKIKNDINNYDSPSSPLGKNSLMAWLDNNNDSFILCLGTDFSSISFLHYLEIVNNVPWNNFFPWEHMHINKIGVSTHSEQVLTEIPGCSKPFINVEKFLLEKGYIHNIVYKGLPSYFVSVQRLSKESGYFFKNNLTDLLCKIDECKACDSRRHLLKKQ